MEYLAVTVAQHKFEGNRPTGGETAKVRNLALPSVGLTRVKVTRGQILSMHPIGIRGFHIDTSCKLTICEIIQLTALKVCLF